MRRPRFPSGRRPRQRRRQHGQAIVYIIAMLPVLFLSIVLVYNAASLTTEKVRLQNTADAATYSASVLVARNLNYLAYTNRAMAANEAGIALLASMQTTVGALIGTMSNVAEAAALVEAETAMSHFVQIPEPIVGQLVHLPKYLSHVEKAHTWDTRAERIARLQKPAAMPFRVGADMLRVLNYGIAASQAAMYTATSAAIGPTVTDVLAANDPKAELPPAETILNTMAFVAQFGTYVRPYSQAVGPGTMQERFEEALRFAHLAKGSRDDFTKFRRIAPRIIGAGGITSKVSSFLLGHILEWRGGTELVSESGPMPQDTRGRIRWQSADTVYIRAPINLLLGDVLPINWRKTDLMDLERFRFGLGGAAAAQGGPNVAGSWTGERLHIPAESPSARVYGNVSDTWGDEALNEVVGDQGVMTRAAFDRAVNSDDRELLFSDPAAALAFLTNSRWRYGPLQQIGSVTSGWYMAPHWDVRTHPQLVEYETDNWWGQQAVRGGNPMKWGAKVDRGPSFTLSVQKPGAALGTAERKGFGRADGPAGLKDGMARDALTAMSSSQVYFRRPQDRWARIDHSVSDRPTLGGGEFGFTGGYIEHRSLFSPYWHVHNVQPSVWARALALGAPLLDAARDADGGE